MLADWPCNAGRRQLAKCNIWRFQWQVLEIGPGTNPPLADLIENITIVNFDIIVTTLAADKTVYERLHFNMRDIRFRVFIALRAVRLHKWVSWKHVDSTFHLRKRLIPPLLVTSLCTSFKYAHVEAMGPGWSSETRKTCCRLRLKPAPREN